MEIIREFATEPGVCVLRTDTYCSTVAHFNMLMEEAKKDFPDLDPIGVEVKQYGGIFYKRTFGIEFKMPEDKVPASYSRRTKLEVTL